MIFVHFNNILILQYSLNKTIEGELNKNGMYWEKKKWP